jgi:serine/threonine protein kinase
VVCRWVRGQFIRKSISGRVYLALDTTTGDIVTVKQADNSEAYRQIEALQYESEILKGHDHSNIVQYLGFNETPRLFSM